MQQLVLVQGNDSLTAAICKVGIKNCEILSVCEQPLPDMAELGATLKKLKEYAVKHGLQKAWSGTALLCLASKDAVFRDWSIPGRSIATARKSLALMLEEEYPCKPDTLLHSHFLRKDSSKSCVQANSMTIAASTMQAWHEGLKAAGLAECVTTTVPWSLLSSIASVKSNTIFIFCIKNEWVVAAIQKGNIVIRIRALGIDTVNQITLLLASKKGDYAKTIAEKLARDVSLLLDGLAFEAEDLLVYGDIFASNAILQAIGKVFAKNVWQLGIDIPVGGLLQRLEENDYSRLVAMSFAQKIIYRWQLRKMPLVRKELARSDLANLARHFWPAAIAVLIIFLAWLGGEVSSIIVKQRQVDEISTAMKKELRQALPDVPGKPGEGKLRSILKSRIDSHASKGNAGNELPMINFLNALHGIVPESIKVDVQKLYIDEKQCRITGTAASYEEVDALRNLCAGIQGIIDARILHASNKYDNKSRPNLQLMNRIEFEISITRTVK